MTTSSLTKFLCLTTNVLFSRTVRNNIRFCSTAKIGDFQYIKVHKAGAANNVGVITLNRPKVSNMICNALMIELGRAIKAFEYDKDVGVIILTGSEKVFVAGVDIKEFQEKTYSTCTNGRFLEAWDQALQVRKPIIAAVNGLALGGGCEAALKCDIIYAGENAKFGQPEILIGTITGSGASQRLPKAIGKSKTMEMLLTGNTITAQEAERMGLVSKVFPVDKLLDEAVKLGEKISSNSQLMNALCKEVVNVSYETSLKEGLRYERAQFYGTFASKDQKEGMVAFMEKRKPTFVNE